MSLREQILTIAETAAKTIEDNTEYEQLVVALSLISDDDLEHPERIENDVVRKYVTLALGSRSQIEDVLEGNETETIPEEIQQKIDEIVQDFSLGKLEKIDPQYHNEVVQKLIEAGQGRDVAENIHYFKGVDHTKTALLLIETGQGEDLADYLSYFEGVDHTKTALLFIETGQGDALIKYLRISFKGLDKEVALKLLEVDKGQHVAKNLDKFKGLNKEVALKLIEGGQGEAVAMNLDKFEGLDKEVALKLIEAEQGEAVAMNLDKFEGVDEEVALKLVEAGQVKIVTKYFAITFKDLRNI